MSVSVFKMTLIGLLFSSACSEPISDQVSFSGPYMGEEPPGMTPKLFAPGLVSTELRELNSVFTPDGKEFYYAHSLGGGQYQIYIMKQLEDGKWTSPEVASFSKDYNSVDLAISYDGTKLYYGTDRPLSGKGDPKEGFDIWMVEREGDGWGDPINLGPALNSGEHQIYPSVTYDETLYFQARREGGYGKSDIYRSRLVEGVYQIPENLGPMINSEYSEGDVFIAPDESYLIVSVFGNPENIGGSDLYISFRKEDGTWTKVKNMGPVINSEGGDLCPMLSPDGNYFFYSSSRNGDPDIWWVDAAIIDTYR